MNKQLRKLENWPVCEENAHIDGDSNDASDDDESVMVEGVPDGKRVVDAQQVKFWEDGRLKVSGDEHSATGQQEESEEQTDEQGRIVHT